MKKKSVFLNCIVVPFAAAVVCLLLMAVLRSASFRRMLGPMRMPAITYYRIANMAALLPCMLFCCRSVFKIKETKKILPAVAAAVLISVVFGFGSNYILTLTGNPARLTLWGMVLNFFVALAVLVIFNLFFTAEFRDAKEIYDAMEESRRETERQARFAAFMNRPAARQQMGRDAVAYKSSSSEKSAVKGAVIGGAVAGPAGAVVGAIVGQNKARQKAGAPAPAVQAVACKKDDGTKTILKDAVIGGVVAGPAGAVVGAIVGKNKVEQDK